MFNELSKGHSFKSGIYLLFAANIFCNDRTPESCLRGFLFALLGHLIVRYRFLRTFLRETNGNLSSASSLPHWRYSLIWSILIGFTWVTGAFAYINPLLTFYLMYNYYSNCSSCAEPIGRGLFINIEIIAFVGSRPAGKKLFYCSKLAVSLRFCSCWTWFMSISAGRATPSELSNLRLGLVSLAALSCWSSAGIPSWLAAIP